MRGALLVRCQQYWNIPPHLRARERRRQEAILEPRRQQQRQEWLLWEQQAEAEAAQRRQEAAEALLVRQEEAAQRQAYQQKYVETSRRVEELRRGTEAGLGEVQAQLRQRVRLRQRSQGNLLPDSYRQQVVQEYREQGAQAAAWLGSNNGPPQPQASPGARRQALPPQPAAAGSAEPAMPAGQMAWGPPPPGGAPWPGQGQPTAPTPTSTVLAPQAQLGGATSSQAPVTGGSFDAFAGAQLDSKFAKFGQLVDAFQRSKDGPANPDRQRRPRTGRAPARRRPAEAPGPAAAAAAAAAAPAAAAWEQQAQQQAVANSSPGQGGWPPRQAAPPDRGWTVRTAWAAAEEPPYQEQGGNGAYGYPPQNGFREGEGAGLGTAVSQGGGASWGWADPGTTAGAPGSRLGTGVTGRGGAYLPAQQNGTAQQGPATADSWTQRQQPVVPPAANAQWAAPQPAQPSPAASAAARMESYWGSPASQPGQKAPATADPGSYASSPAGQPVSPAAAPVEPAGPAAAKGAAAVVEAELLHPSLEAVYLMEGRAGGVAGAQRDGPLPGAVEVRGWVVGRSPATGQGAATGTASAEVPPGEYMDW
ncbi:hypothetical protein N2152v2_001963 [Parachlorella kessleri]